ncbi:MAG TPA: hypothetical protein VJH95_02095 [Candidatus Nanoarchaeia archaeon]|nr:hypothetical protein [Candidatus Nanoarchaeia archaeon]
MEIKKLIKASFLEFLPVIIMIALIPVIKNDWALVAVYAILIIISFFIKLEKRELTIFISSAILLTLFELLFISTGVETFKRNSLFNLMPAWLPLLWGYAMVAGKRFILNIHNYNPSHLNISIKKHSYQPAKPLNKHQLSKPRGDMH